MAVRINQHYAMSIDHRFNHQDHHQSSACSSSSHKRDQVFFSWCCCGSSSPCSPKISTSSSPWTPRGGGLLLADLRPPSTWLWCNLHAAATDNRPSPAFRAGTEGRSSWGNDLLFRTPPLHGLRNPLLLLYLHEAWPSDFKKGVRGERWCKKMRRREDGGRRSMRLGVRFAGWISRGLPQSEMTAVFELLRNTKGSWQLHNFPFLFWSGAP